MQVCMTQEQVIALQAEIAEANAAYKKLMFGQAVAEFDDMNGERVKFNKADTGQLYLYTQRLQAQLPCDVLGGLNIPRPLTFTFP